ncbi:hypothetical protein [Pilimelia columellifera]|uniref:Uncharacterized protein n=1 Tax=Pilimelia columellifera subsp. columellifera TaxID=706583 RepID=A0ABP6AWM0_9ACTN
MRTHRTDLTSLLFGLLFLLFVGWWALGRHLELPRVHPGWLVAGGLVILGAAGLARALRGGAGDDTPAVESGD